MRWILPLVTFIGGCILDADGFVGPPDSGTSPDGGSQANGGDGGPSPAGPTDAGTGGSTDSSSTQDTSTASPNLLTNGDFELGCAGWKESFAFISEATTPFARSGTHSCKLCMNTNFDAWMDNSTNTTNLVPGDKLFAEVWIRRASIPSGAGFTGDSLNVFTSGDEDGTSGPFPLTDEWQRITTVLNITKPSTTAGIGLHLRQSGNPAAAGNIICVYVDDAVLRKL